MSNKNDSLNTSERNGRMNNYKVPVLVIDGLYIPLPEEAKYAFQENNGVWYWSSRRPRIVFAEHDLAKEIGWTHTKKPVLVESEYKHKVPLITQLTAKRWQDTLQLTMSAELMPDAKFLLSAGSR